LGGAERKISNVKSISHGLSLFEVLVISPADRTLRQEARPVPIPESRRAW
jgi:hypothetical protein